MLKDNATVKINYKNKIDGFKLLEQINDVSIKTIFFDPEYRGILDKMSYGNEGKSRGKERCSLQQWISIQFRNFLKNLKEF